MPLVLADLTTHCTGEFEMPDPPKGVLEFDYVSTARPRRYTRKMRRQYVCVALSVSFPWFGRQLCWVSRRVSRAFVRLGRYLSQKLKKLEYTPETVAHKDWDPDAVRVVDSTKCDLRGVVERLTRAGRHAPSPGATSRCESGGGRRDSL